MTTTTEKENEAFEKDIFYYKNGFFPGEYIYIQENESGAV